MAFKNNKNTTKTMTTFRVFMTKGLLLIAKSKTSFFKFPSGTVKDFDQDALRELIECKSLRNNIWP